MAPVTDISLYGHLHDVSFKWQINNFIFEVDHQIFFYVLGTQEEQLKHVSFPKLT